MGTYCICCKLDGIKGTAPALGKQKPRRCVSAEALGGAMCGQAIATLIRPSVTRLTDLDCELFEDCRRARDEERARAAVKIASVWPPMPVGRSGAARVAGKKPLAGFCVDLAGLSSGDPP